MFLIFVCLLAVLTRVQCALSNSKNDDSLISHATKYNGDELINVLLVNNLEESCDICWVPNRPIKKNPFCMNIEKFGSNELQAVVNHRFSLSCQQAGDVVFQVSGGKHIYHFKDYFLPDSSSRPSDVIHVFTPNECSDINVGFHVLGISWRDAVRTAAFRHHKEVCMCGGFNSSSSFVMTNPNPELPLIHDGNFCHCDEQTTPFDMYIPCSFGLDSLPMQQSVDCESLLSQRKEEDLRLFYLHSTEMVDTVTMKHKLWASLQSIFGFHQASEIMPSNFDLNVAAERNTFRSLCESIVANDRNRNEIFITVCLDLSRVLISVLQMCCFTPIHAFFLSFFFFSFSFLISFFLCFFSSEKRESSSTVGYLVVLGKPIFERR